MSSFLLLPVPFPVTVISLQITGLSDNSKNTFSFRPGPLRKNIVILFRCSSSVSWIKQAWSPGFMSVIEWRGDRICGTAALRNTHYSGSRGDWTQTVFSSGSWYCALFLRFFQEFWEQWRIFEDAFLLSIKLLNPSHPHVMTVILRRGNDKSCHLIFFKRYMH